MRHWRPKGAPNIASILRPRALNAGDTVAVAALSGGLEEAEASLFALGVEALEQMGFTVHVSPLVDLARRWWWGAAPPRETADEFNRLLRDPEIRAIFALTGGRLTMSYLDLIDYEAIRADPKPVVGFSDIDALHLAIHARTGLVSVHGDMVTHGIGDWPQLDHDRRERLADAYRRLLMSNQAVGELPGSPTWESWRPGRAQGQLMGGLLNRLIKVQATPFALDLERFDGAILFWEDLVTHHAGVWNDLHVLRYEGVLDRIVGMIVGPTSTIEPTEGGPETLREIVLDVLEDRDIPVLGNVDIGHEPPNIPLPLGVRAEIDADSLALTLLEPAVS
jgi:muramoyltetrapeptide carboxypeptidase